MLSLQALVHCHTPSTSALLIASVIGFIRRLNSFSSASVNSNAARPCTSTPRSILACFTPAGSFSNTDKMYATPLSPTQIPIADHHRPQNSTSLYTFMSCLGDTSNPIMRFTIVSINIFSSACSFASMNVSPSPHTNVSSTKSLQSCSNAVPKKWLYPNLAQIGKKSAIAANPWSPPMACTYCTSPVLNLIFDTHSSLLSSSNMTEW